MPDDPNSAMGFDGRRADDHESTGVSGSAEVSGSSESGRPADARGQAGSGGSAQASGLAQAAGSAQVGGSANVEGAANVERSAGVEGAAEVDDDVEHTGETRNQMLQRNVGELLQELRVAQAGVQILFGFLLSVVFTGRFHDASGFEKTLHLLAVLLTVAATALLIAPAAWHRILFRTGRREQILRVGNRVVLVGFGCLAAAITVTVALIAKVSFGPVAMGLVGGMAILLFGLLWFAVPGMLVGDRRRRDGH